MKKLVAMALSLTLAVSMLTACGGTKETKAETSAETTAEISGETTAAADGESLKVALCVTGAVNDMGLDVYKRQIWQRPPGKWQPLRLTES